MMWPWLLQIQPLLTSRSRAAEKEKTRCGCGRDVVGWKRAMTDDGRLAEEAWQTTALAGMAAARGGVRGWHDACPLEVEVGLAWGGAAGGWRPAWRGWWRRRRARRDEALPAVEEASTVRRGGASGGFSLVYGARRLAGEGAGAVVPCAGRSLTVVGHRASRGLAGGERRVKTQPGLTLAGNDDVRSVIPLLRELSCRLIPQVWMSGESPVSVLFETLTDSGGGIFRRFSSWRRCLDIP